MNDKPLIVVCGQPRSGTSMLMRIMEFGGVDVEYDTDRNRPQLLQQFNNLHGMYETSKPSYTKCFKCWHPDQAEKIAVPAIFIYIERNIEDVKRSWEDIRSRTKSPINRTPEMIEKRNTRIAKTRKQWHSFLEGKKVLKIQFEDVLTNPIKELEKIAAFVERPFNVQKANTAIDHTL